MESEGDQLLTTSPKLCHVIIVSYTPERAADVTVP